MIIDLSDSISLILTIVLTTLFEALGLYVATHNISNRRSYIALFSIAAIAIMVIYSLHFWDTTKNILYSIVPFFGNMPKHFHCTLDNFITSITQFTNDWNAQLLLPFVIVLNIPLFFIVYRTNKSRDIFTKLGVFLFLFIFPILIILFEIATLLYILDFLNSANRIAHIPYILMIYLGLKAVVTFIIFFINL